MICCSFSSRFNVKPYCIKQKSFLWRQGRIIFTKMFFTKFSLLTMLQQLKGLSCLKQLFGDSDFEPGQDWQKYIFESMPYECTLYCTGQHSAVGSMWTFATKPKIVSSKTRFDHYFSKNDFLKVIFTNLFDFKWKNRSARSLVRNIKSISQILRPGCQLKKVPKTPFSD